MVLVKIKRWWGWRTIKGVTHEWISGRTTCAGIEYIPASKEGENGKLVKKIRDVTFPLTLSVTLKDGTIEYIPDIENKRLRILER